VLTLKVDRRILEKILMVVVASSNNAMIAYWKGRKPRLKRSKCTGEKCIIGCSSKKEKVLKFISRNE
jgi:hypothetical protein